MSTRRKRPSSRPRTTISQPLARSVAKAPFDTRLDTNAIGQVGRRPAAAWVPLITGVMWIIVGVVMFVAFNANWKYIVGSVCIGIGGLFLRGGLAAVARRNR